ncbi:MAG: hypothetical protein ACRDWF_13785, partial [Acidimicrobiia bacterium]
MSQVMDPAAPVEVELRPAPPLDMRRAVRLGLAGGAAMVLVAATGMVATFQPRLVIDPIVPLGVLFLYLLAFAFGWMAGQPPATLEGYEPATAGAPNVLAGALAGLLAGLSLSLLLIAITVFDLRGVFINMSPELAEILGFGLPVAAAVFVIALASAFMGALGASVHLLSRRVRRTLIGALTAVIVFSLLTDLFGQLFAGLSLEPVIDFLYTGRGGALTIIG